RPGRHAGSGTARHLQLREVWPIVRSHRLPSGRRRDCCELARSPPPQPPLAPPDSGRHGLAPSGTPRTRPRRRRRPDPPDPDHRRRALWLSLPMLGGNWSGGIALGTIFAILPPSLLFVFIKFAVYWLWPG